MAQYEHLPIYRKAFDLSVYLENVARNFSRYHKYTLGADLRNISRMIVRLIIRANSEGRGWPRLKPLYRFRETFPSVRSQYRYFANRFKGSAVFMQVGCFYEFYSPDSSIPVMFDLKPLKPNNRRARYGFPVSMGGDYARRVAQKGLTVVFVTETDKYIDRIKCRLPSMKVSAASWMP